MVLQQKVNKSGTGVAGLGENQGVLSALNSPWNGQLRAFAFVSRGRRKAAALGRLDAEKINVHIISQPI